MTRRRRKQKNIAIYPETAETSDRSLLRSHPNTLGEGQVYYYHRDHLGSTQSVTDGAGNIAQMVEYTPWGEVFVELKGDSILTTPYLFNGKELDEETGLYYYGARYYDPKMSVWYSTDPICEKYYDVSPYAYCANNPVNAFDPDGRKVLLVGDVGLALQTIKSTLPNELQKYVVLENNYISVTELIKGIKSTEHQESENFLSLYELVSDPVHTVEFSISDVKKANYWNGKEVPQNEIPLPFNEPVCDEYTNFVPEPNGSVGWTLAPVSHEWTKNDMLQRNRIPKDQQLFSTNDNYQVQINGKLLKYKSLNIELVKAAAHELYSHIIHMFRGIDSLHTPIREGPGSNLELEIRSKQRINEAIINYNH